MTNLTLCLFAVSLALLPYSLIRRRMDIFCPAMLAFLMLAITIMAMLNKYTNPAAMWVGLI